MSFGSERDGNMIFSSEADIVRNADLNGYTGSNSLTPAALNVSKNCLVDLTILVVGAEDRWE